MHITVSVVIDDNESDLRDHHDRLLEKLAAHELVGQHP